MRITDLLDVSRIDIHGAPKTKTEALNQMIALMTKSGNITDVESYRAEVFHREEEGTTGVGDGIAIPHGKGDFVKKATLAAMVVKDGVEYQAMDDEPVHLIFLIAAPNTKDNVHLDVLAKLSVMLMNEGMTTKLLNACRSGFGAANAIFRKTLYEWEFMGYTGENQWGGYPNADEYTARTDPEAAGAAGEYFPSGLKGAAPYIRIHHSPGSVPAPRAGKAREGIRRCRCL